MKILINTPTGHVGRAVTEELLRAGEDITVIARYPEKLGEAASRVRVVKGSLDDPTVLDQAFAGVETVFWATPPISSPDHGVWARRIASLAVAAAKKAGTKRAVILSSISAQVPAGTGPIATLHPVEKEFRAGFEHLMILRPASFMENHLASVSAIAGMGSIFAPAPGSFRFPQIATRDIAARAARLLRQRDWIGQQVLGLHGPADVSYEQVAAAVSKAIGKPVSFVQVTPGQAREGMLGMGMPAFVADAYLEMIASMGNGVFHQAEPRSAETTTPTTIEQFASEVLKPAIEAAITAGAKA